VQIGYVYYIYAIIDSQTIQITNQSYGNVWQLNTASGTMVMNFSSNTSYIQASTSNMVVNYPIQFTGSALGGLSVGTTYYIQDIIDGNDFTISGTLNTVTVTQTNSSNGGMTVSSTSSLQPLVPIVFTNTVFGGIVDSQKYYISQIIDSSTFSVASSLITVNATATALSTNLITVTSTAGFVPNQPIQFVGNTFGGIMAETIYYVLAVNNSTTFTISQAPGGGAVALTSATGLVTVRTCPAATTLTTTSGSMVGTTTAKKATVTLGVGAMNATFSTSLFGGVVLGTTYYVNSIPTSTSFTVATTPNGSSISLVNKSGSMNVAAVGWDHINPGTPIQATLDSSSTYYIEPRTTFTAPPFSQSVANSTTTLAAGTAWTSMAYGNGRWIAIPTSGTAATTTTDGSNWTQIALPNNLTWTGIAYGNGYWIAVASGVGAQSMSYSTAAVSKSNGSGWRTVNLPSATTWSNIAYGNGTFVTIATGTNTGAYSTNYGNTWNNCQTATTITSSAITGFTVSGGTATITFNSQTYTPFVVGTTVTLSGFTPAQTSGTVNNVNATFTVTSSSQTQVQFALTGSYTSATFGTILGTQAGLPSGGTWTSIAYGNNLFVAISSGGTAAMYSSDGITWRASTLPASTTWSSVAYGQGIFVAVSNTSNTTAYTINGSTWYSSNIAITADKVVYGNGLFVALSAISTTAYWTEDALQWTQQTVTNDGYGCAAFGLTLGTYNSLFVTLANQSTGSYISAGAKTKGRASVTSGVITSINEWEPGGGNSLAPTVTFTDPNVTTLAVVTPRISNGVLSSPSFYNRGLGYSTNSTAVVITGNGYADQYQTGLQIILNNLTRLPSPGDNLTIAGVTQVYKVTSAYAVYNTVVPYMEANVSISPSMTTANSTANGTTVSIRSKYSQARLTNHDFLNIGYGDFVNSNYPGYPVGGYVATSNNQTVEANYGRVFFTSTDQDGNFKVGNLFGVQQATGIVTLSASQFGLTGLSTLSLGGIAVGGSSVVITQFSTDGTFTANSDYIIPTQKAIKSYLNSRLSQGGANTFTGQLIAGTISVGGAVYIKSTVPNGTTGSSIKMLSKVNFAQNPGLGLVNVGVDGNAAALAFFARNAFHR